MTDVCVPISHLPEIIVKAKEDIVRLGIIGKLYCCRPMTMFICNFISIMCEISPIKRGTVSGI